MNSMRNSSFSYHRGTTPVICPKVRWPDSDAGSSPFTAPLVKVSSFQLIYRFLIYEIKLMPILLQVMLKTKWMSLPKWLA